MMSQSNSMTALENHIVEQLKAVAAAANADVDEQTFGNFEFQRATARMIGYRTQNFR